MEEHCISTPDDDIFVIWNVWLSYVTSFAVCPIEEMQNRYL
jgi:hypothetical protein